MTGRPQDLFCSGLAWYAETDICQVCQQTSGLGYMQPRGWQAALDPLIGSECVREILGPVLSWGWTLLGSESGPSFLCPPAQLQIWQGTQARPVVRRQRTVLAEALGS